MNIIDQLASCYLGGGRLTIKYNEHIKIHHLFHQFWTINKPILSIKSQFAT